MSNDKIEVDRIEYVYPEDVQAQLDRIDSEVANIARMYAQMYADSCHLLTLHDRMRFKVLYQSAVYPLLAEKARLIARTVPNIILNVTEKPTLY